MIVTRIEDADKNKKKIYLDGEYTFFLYPRELRQYPIEVNEELSDELYEEIRKNVILVRAKRKMLALLSKKDYTCEEIARKLRQGCYSEDVIEEAIAYGISKSYLDDERYAREYVAWKKSSKSFLQISYELSKKGIARSICDSILSEEEEDVEALRELIERYRNRQSGEEVQKRQKTYRHFLQKGYSSSLIHQILSENCGEN